MVYDQTRIICSVLSLRDSCVMYPSCPQCVSRLQKKHLEPRHSCQKCGFTTEEENISYRYRLSLSVKRQSDIFGVTVFGSCLNPYFGIPAVGLQRFFDESQKNAKDPQSDCVHRLLRKAVEDCFVGKQFEFGIKQPGHETGTRSLFNERGLPASLASRRISGDFVASRMTLPRGAAGGSSVLSYFKKLLQVSHVRVCGSANPERPPASPEHVDSLALRSFECSLASFSRSSSWGRAGGHCFPGFWKRSPGVINSSAEQEEHSCSRTELNEAGVGSQGWSRTSRRSPRECSHGTHSYDLSPEHCSLEVKGLGSCNDCSQGSCLGGSRETARSSPPDCFPCSRSSLPDSPALTSSVTESENRTSLKPSVVERVELEQNDRLGLKPGWRGVLSEGNDETSSCQEELSVFGWSSKLSNSSAWVDLPFSESWGEFISEVHRPSEVSLKDKVCDSVEGEAKISEADCVDEIHSHAKSRRADMGCTSERPFSFIILSGGNTSCLHSAQDQEQNPMAVVQQPFIKSPEVCRTENRNLSANDANVKQSEVFRAHMPTSDHPAHDLDDQERQKRELSLLVPDLKGLTAQGHSNYCVQNGIKTFSCVGSGADQQGFRRDVSERELDVRGWEEQTMADEGPFCATDAYNASADLFGSCQNGVSVVEEEDKRVKPRPQCRPLKLLKSCCPLVDVCPGGRLTPIENPGTDRRTLGSEISDPLDFAPSLQSTPISGNLIPLRLLPCRGEDQTPCTLTPRDNMSWHHRCRVRTEQRTESESEKENMRDCASEDTLPVSIGKIGYSSKPQSRARNVKRPVAGKRCKRILLASRGRKSCSKVQSSRIHNSCEDTVATKVRCALSDTTCVLSCTKQKNCVKSAHLGGEGQRLAEMVASECVASENSSALDTTSSRFCADPGGMDQSGMGLDWSADLFADSFRI